MAIGLNLTWGLDVKSVMFVLRDAGKYISKQVILSQCRMQLKIPILVPRLDSSCIEHL